MKKTDNTPAITFPEVGTITDPKALKKIYKKLTDAQLDEWLDLEGLTGNLKLSGHDSIDRMRKCMLISALHFPKAPSEKAKKSKYADYTTEKLVEMCMENDLVLRDDKGDARILRMYSVMALKEAGVLA